MNRRLFIRYALTAGAIALIKHNPVLAGYYYARGGAAACSEGSATVMCDTVSGETDITENAIGMSFTLASQESWWGVELMINAVSDPGTYDFKIGTDPDLSNSGNVLDTISGVSVSATAADNYSEVQFTTCLTLPAGTYYMGVVAASGGDLDWQRNPTSACADMAGRSGTGWNLSGSNTYDYAWKKIANGS